MIDRLLWRNALRAGSWVILSAIAYYGGARLGYAFAIPHAFVTLWPPAGITLALLLLNRRTTWPMLIAGTIAGSVASDLQSGYSVALAIGAALANTGESALAAWILVRGANTPWRIGSIRDIGAFVLGAAVVSNAITATAGAAVLHWGFNGAIGVSWLTWWVGDGLGMLIVAPVILIWVDARHHDIVRTIPRLVEGACLAICLAFALHEVFASHPWWVGQPGPYAVFPFLVWAGVRFGALGAVTSTLVVTAWSTWAAALGGGPVLAPSPTTTDVALQVYAFLLVAMTCALVPAIALEQRTLAEQHERESEERLRFAMSAARLGVWDVDLRTGRTQWSDTLAALHGLSPRSFGETLDAFLACVHEEDRQAVSEAIDVSVRNRTDSNVLYRTIWPDGSVRWLNGMGRTIYDAQGAPIRAAGIAFDVTERRSVEERSRESQKLEAIGQLAGGIAHDFNNLLTVILSYASIAADALTGTADGADIAEIKVAAERAAALTRQLLAFSRRQILAPQVLNLSETLGAMEPMLRRLIGEHIEVQLRTRTVGNIKADQSQVEQVILNLSANARDAMPDGGQLSIEVSNTHIGAIEEQHHGDIVPGEYVLLAVSDTGVGMDAGTVTRIFEPFFTTKRLGKGTGLGLATVHGIVKQSGGAVWVYSEEGRGTTFKVFFPRVNDTVGGRRQDVAESGGSGSETILVVEDEERIRTLAHRILTAQGYLVLIASTPSEARGIERNHAGTIDLLLSDVVLPQMSGTALAEMMLLRRPNMRVLYMSGYTDDAIVRRGVLEDSTHFVQKPFDPSSLLRKIREALDENDTTDPVTG